MRQTFLIFQKVKIVGKKHFMLKFLPRRPDFAKTMTEEEKKIVQQHTAYCRDYMSRGVMLAFGPVFDPKGTYGIGIVAVENEEEIRRFIEKDPASTIHLYEYYPMNAVTPEK